MIGDAKSRELILTDFRNTLFVEAGAGSGKTTAMVSRIMMIVIEGRARIQDIVAITFTNEGAASLRSKILQELERASYEGAYAPQGGETLRMLDDSELERIHTALDNLPLAHFSTIHSFCLSMLKERPVEAGIDPRFDMNTEGNVPSPFNNAWLQFLLESASHNHPFIRFMLEHGLSVDTAADIARIRCENADLVLHTGKVEPLTDKDIERAFAETTKSIVGMHDRIGLIESERESGERAKRLTFVRDVYKRAAQCDTVERKKELLTSLEVNRKWNKSLAYFDTETERLAGICHGICKQRDDFLHAHMAGFAEEYMTWFTRHKKTTSSLYFDDLLFLTREMLRTNTEVREYFKNRYTYLFIDETQDTDPLQSEIVFFLCEQPGTCASRWQDVALKPSKLFMVGDPKQSIYRFRRADISMYEDARERIAKQGGRILNLEKNFRSAREIIRFVNDHFEDSFGAFTREQSLKLQPKYVPLTEGKNTQSKLPKHIVSLVSRGDKPTFLREEAEQIVSLVSSITGNSGPAIVDPGTGKERAIQLSDIMLLLRSTTDVELYERIFEEADIPHYQVGGKTFFATEDIRGLVFALQAIDDATDTVSLFGALRSPVFGLADQVLFEYVSGGRRLSLFAKHDDPEGVVAQALALLKKLHRRRERLGPSGVVKELLNASGMCHVVMMEQNGVQKASRYFRFLELVYELERDRIKSFRAIVEGLRQVMEMDDPQLANVTIAKPAENAMKITTIHRAKGLESPVVILANGNRKPWNPPPSSFVLREEGKIVVPYEEGGFYELDADIPVELEKMRDESENERLRYVAATRARDLLVLCIPDENESKTFNGRFAGSLKINPLVGSVDTYRTTVRPAPPRKKSVDVRAVFGKAHTSQEQFRQQLAASLDGMRSQFSSVHDTMTTDEALFKMQRKSFGKAFGILLHRIMQNHVTAEEFAVDAILDQWMEDEGVPRRHRDNVLEAYARLTQQPHVQSAMQSSHRHAEWEFYVTHENGILNGVIDLVYRNKQGQWVIVDYKTDDVTDPERKKRLDEFYGVQLRQYANAFETVTGEKVSETVLLYAGV